jgi:hypothetical protein
MARYHESTNRAAALQAADKIENRQKYSLYVPVTTNARRKTSVSKRDDQVKKERESLLSRASADPATGRRRGTMRSKEHDDEEEQLRRALEESKREVDGAGNGKRNGKRGRDEGDEYVPRIREGWIDCVLTEDCSIKQEAKRQRTASESITSMSRTATVEDESDEDTTTLSRAKKLRAEAAQTARQAELREKEKERELARAEAAGRRQERAGRRRGDERDPADETPKPENSAKTSPPPSSQPPSPPSTAAPEKAPPKRGPGKKTKKLGNNQYTKMREASNQPATSSPHMKKRQLNNGAASSGDEQLPNGGDSSNPTTSNGTNKNSPGQENGPTKGPGKFGKGKKLLNGHKQQPDEPMEMSLPNMKRVMDGMAVFMQRAQVEMAGDRTPPGGEVAVSVQSTESTVVGGVGDITEKPFAEMSSMEMAVVLERHIEVWNRRFAHLVA